MACGYQTKSKENAIKMASLYLECASYVSIAKTSKGDMKVYPRVKDKNVFHQCVSNKGGAVSKEWINPPEKEAEQ